ncbi:hypothetical protein COT51_03360 [candidate division WWE3 bacterium CG08_land_8_20_14_0_20_41_15]|uniref:Uncharacterized protein n=1 Tax=candidate division WWE3 bacterium CG08_land_8_20_14_0_20_41_15 TaxID=1975086 RepID=A0A2H0X8U2_UNCKA|nr:MAG: hypothetical protein COT51_03360 [candidate division WWE3 bacterium CG08_land_8_20_14_0_20_41_15]
MKKCKKLLGIITAFAFVMMTVVPSQAYAVAVSADKINSAAGLIQLVDPVRVKGNVYPHYAAGNYTLGTLAAPWTTTFTKDAYFLPKSAASTTSEGYVYYDSDDDNLYVYANGGWVDLTLGATGAISLDDAYNTDSGERTVLVEAGDVSWDMSSSYNYILDMQGTGDIIFQDNGTAAFTFSDTGVATFAGSAEGTSVLTLTAGDLLVSDGDVTLSGGELSVTTDDTTTDAVTIAGNTLTTGQALAIIYDASTHTSGNVFEISDNDASVDFAVAEDGVTTITGAAEGTSALVLTAGDAVVTNGDVTISSGELALTTDDTTTDAVTISGNTLTTGQALAVIYDASTHTSGNVFEVSDADAGVDFAIAEDGATTLTGSAEGTSVLTLTTGDLLITDGDLTISGGEIATTTDDTITDAMTISGNTLTTGQALAIIYDASTHTSGNVFEISDADAAVDFAVAEDGAITITGSAEGTNALTLTTGDLVVTDGDLTLSGGEVAIVTDDTTTDAVTITGSTLTTGQALAVIYDASTHTSGNVFEISDADAAVDFAVAEDGATTITGSAAGTAALTLTTGDITVTDGSVNVGGNVVPEAAGTRNLGSATLEWAALYMDDDTGINFGLDQDALLAYDETTDDRVELTGTGATLYVEDVLTLGKQAETINGANDSVTITASYLEVTATAATDDIILATTGVTEGDILIMVNVAANAFQVDGDTATMKIDGGADFDVAQYHGLIFVFDGTNWLQLTKITTNS